MTGLQVYSKSDQWRSKQNKTEYLVKKYIYIYIESCLAIKWLKYNCNKGILFIQIMGIFVLFGTSSLLTEKQN